MSDDPPRGDSPAVCQYCDRKFPTERVRTLHKGQAHSAALSDDERRAVQEAGDRETAELRRLRLKAVLAIVLVYFLFLFAYAVFS